MKRFSFLSLIILVLLFGCRTAEYHEIILNHDKPTESSTTIYPDNIENAEKNILENEENSNVFIDSVERENTENIETRESESKEAEIQIEPAEVEENPIDEVKENSETVENTNEIFPENDTNPLPQEEVNLKTEDITRIDPILNQSISNTMILLLCIFAVIIILMTVAVAIRNTLRQSLPPRQSIPIALLFTALPFVITLIITGWNYYLLFYLILLTSFFVFNSKRGQ